VPWRYDGGRPELRHAPLLGAHTDEVLREWAGFGPGQADELRETGVLA
jgi:crotonobetainyl-CoA:carnitine CoA-transferase CaiB-like acyl-CoA transferase